MWRLLTLVALLVGNHSLASEVSPGFQPIKAHIAPSSARIIGGEEVEPHSVPFQAAVRINYLSYCGGALISPNYVLTAGHCGRAILIADVVLGAHNLSNSEEATQVTIKVNQTILHEEYDNDNLHNDIALLQLQEPAPINDVIQTIPLPSRDDSTDTYLDFVATATGWGLTKDVESPSIRDMSDVLLKVEVAVSNLTECKTYYNDEEGEYVYDTNVCTSGYRKKGTCNGDSGGPLVYNEVLIGITSFGTTQCEMCSPSVYTKIADYLDWIAENSDVEIQ